MSQERPCPSGFYGTKCDRSCPATCLGNACSQETGFCNECELGWRGLSCDKACDFGRFGSGCKQFCSYKCSNIACDPVSGACVAGCAQGYRLPDCNEECEDGYYGYNCTQTCSTNCQNGTCDGVTGKCHLGCVAGYQTDQCDKECDPTFYGKDCKEKCISACLNNQCNHITGACKDCPPGTTGDRCNKNCMNGSYGISCARQCSKNCRGSKGCDIETGECNDGCEIGFMGSLCDQSCESKTYGSECKSNCSQFCVVDLVKEPSVCHHVSGKCHLGCVNEYEGPQCVQPKGSATDFNPGAIAGPIVVAFIVVLVLVIGVFFWRKWRRTKNKNIFDNESRTDINDLDLSRPQEISSGVSDMPVAAGKSALYSDILHSKSTTNNDEIYYNTTSQPYETAINVKDLNTFMLSHSNDFFVEQFKKIPVSCNASMAVAQSPENKHKNRYKNICAYDHSRVQLMVDIEKKHGDYINASYVQGYKSKQKFIASQGPNKATLEDFVRLLWEQKTELVVMLTNLVEDGKPKCEKYWPTSDELVLGEVKVRLAAMQMFDEYIIRRLQLLKVGQPTHSLTQFHYTAWPDKGVPPTPWSLIDFEQQVASYSTSKPIVIHCSAGVGRTGTFIGLYNIIKEAEDTGHMDFYSTLWKLRQDRTCMIQTVEQYIFLHKAAQVAMVCSGTDVRSIDDIVGRINDMETVSDSGLTKMEREFKDLCSVCTNGTNIIDEDCSSENASTAYQNSCTMANKLKNRFSNVLPSLSGLIRTSASCPGGIWYGHLIEADDRRLQPEFEEELYRPHLYCESKDMGDYINAVLLQQSYNTQNSQILTQLPLPTTVIDFWRMVTQYKVQLIVAFEADFDDLTVGVYLPSEDCPMQCGSFEIETKSKQSNALWEEKLLTVIKQKKKKNGLSTFPMQHMEDQEVTHMKCVKFDLDPEYLLAVVKQVRSYRPRDKVLYMCRNGADCSGLLCVLSLLLDRMDSDQQVMVPLIVGSVKTVRPQVIPTLDQYRVLYQVLKLQMQFRNTESNCAGFGTKIGLTNQAFERNENEKNVYSYS